nr:replication protein A 70 kDa DNA-binding subunit B [Tanacetum cinerariifolium]
VAFCPGLRFVLDRILSSTAFYLFEDRLLRFAKDKLCQIQNCVAFCLVLGFASKDCVLKNLALCPKDLAFCSRRILQKEVIHLILTGIGDDIYSTVDACQIAQEMWEVIERLQQVPEYTTVETPMNMSPENKAHFLAEKEVIHLILTGIGDDIYSTVDACQIAQEITSSNSKNKNVDTNPLYKNDDHSGQFGNQRMVNVVGARENVGSKVVQQSRIQCSNCREFGHFVKECRKPKRVKDSAYHKEKMLLCKQAEQGVPLQAEQYDRLAYTDEEVNEQELEAHYNYMAKIQEVPTADSGTDSELMEQVQNEAGYNVFASHLQHSEQSESVSSTCLVETNDSNVILDSSNMYEDNIQNEQNDVDSDDERVALANLKLDTKQAEFEKYKAFNNRTVDYDKLELVSCGAVDYPIIKGKAVKQLRFELQDTKGIRLSITSWGPYVEQVDVELGD